MKDLSSSFSTALLRKDEWSFEEFQSTISEVCACIPNSISDWEEEETWATIVSDDKVVALICAVVPLVFFDQNHRKAIEEIANKSLALFIAFGDYYSKEYSINPEVLEDVFKISPAGDMSAFGEHQPPPRDYQNISAEEIWFYTV